MGSNNNKGKPLEEILLLCLDGRLSEQELAWLDKQLIETPAIARRYAEFMAIYAGLREPGKISGISDTPDTEDIGEEVDSPEEDNILLEYIEKDKKFREQKAIEEARRQAELKKKEVEKTAEILLRKFQQEEERRQEELFYLRERVRRSNFVFATIAAVIMVFVGVLWLITDNTGRKSLSPAVPEKVAVISDAIEAQWDRPGISTKLGTKLAAGSLVLRKGFVELTFNKGARVVLEAPVRVNIKDSQHILLSKGKLAARVLPSALGFTVDTPGASMRDLGTEFGVNVKNDGDSELHVFKGKVILKPAKANQKDRGLLVYKGQARCVDIVSGRVKDITLNRNAFLAHVPSAYELAVRAAGPDVYWRVEDMRRYLMDVVRSKEIKCEYTGRIRSGAGPMLGDGKMAKAIVFLGGGGIFIPHLSPLIRGKRIGHSYVFWLRVDELGKQDILVETNKGMQQYRHFGVNEKGNFEVFTDFFKKGKIVDKYISRVGIQTGRWYHIALIRSATKALAGKIVLYVNGIKQIDATMHQSYMTRYIGNYYIARVPVQVKTAGWRPLHGAIAELAEYSRVLSPREIKAMYNSIRKNKN